MPPHTSPTSRPLSDDEKIDMLNFFEKGDHQHLRAVLIALTVDPKLGPAVLKTMKRDVLPYMETDVADLRMIQKKPKRSLRDAPWWDKAYSNPEYFINPDTWPLDMAAYAVPSPASSPRSVLREEFDEKFFKWSADPGDENPRPATPRATKKRKVRESTTHTQEAMATLTKPLKEPKAEPSSPSAYVLRKSLSPARIIKGPKTRAVTQKENEKVVPVETVARRVLERLSYVKDFETCFMDLGETSTEYPSRPENPVASVLSGRDHNIVPSPKRNPATPKMKAIIIKKEPSSLKAVPVAERKIPSPPSIPRSVVKS
ncbi:hypothetical protein BDY19DRAFT_995776 [Irpex rosettiformis]|uniref:Uncharacterized protein n=1 Tax=Irpex rosettiformis TaxID=378272 RepID=A0ACB8TWW5_9APHY|nr:hypothetical protein BDY19DRAFT_995776 [Irpex rosettiformis]